MSAKPDQPIVTIQIDQSPVDADSFAAPGVLVMGDSDAYSFRVTGPLPAVVRALAYHLADVSGDDADALATVLRDVKLADLDRVFGG